MNASLVVMAKAPVPGQVKTRLARDVGPGRALQVYRWLLAVTGRVARAWPGPVVLASAGPVDAFAGTGLEHFETVPQPATTLGPRIAAALRAGLLRAPAVVVVGSDCPSLSTAALDDVMALLQSSRVAFGPSADGGFWSIATTAAATAAVLDRAQTTWSAPDTLRDLRAELATAQLPSLLGAVLHDCDTGADLDRALAAGQLPRLDAGTG